ncbi:DNA recombination protein RmuC [Vibrio sp. SS-MA-C1-2]|uniref:DNA recombination protein RmuC n=1 Tax=Vibrio sp. SS-MA-C1-2 TaxID=2908646 RepID=UPI001F339453|nr:DNA recombination protein RmuC [Vibrio sp. SS-MA-C1-2]UJF19370.1 DNA recombination protein RmuC [Vibrio sp. SS-MA-C1-2]
MSNWLISNGMSLEVGLIGFGVAVFIVSLLLARWSISQKAKEQQRWAERQIEEIKNLTQQQIDHYQQQNDQQQEEIDQLDMERDRLMADQRQMHGKLTAAIEKLRIFDQLRQEKLDLESNYRLLQQSHAEQDAQHREQVARFYEQQQSANEKIALLENAELRLKSEFTNLANELFEQKTQSVDEQNKVSLDGILTPLKEQLEGFRKQVNDGFGDQAKERHTLIHEIRNLQQLNDKMSQEALNLTKALKGDNKQQGNWGEMVLSQVLESSGLREGYEYDTQVNLDSEQGKRYQPDIVVHLPNDKDVIIDAKMALVAYERYFNAESFDEQETALNDHVAALKAHIRGLAKKDYQLLNGVNSLDYVLMFIPVEPAFQVAISADPSLVNQALNHNILLVSPTTLMVALRTINNLWRHEKQNQNAQIIAERASKLYDKVRLFVSDMENIGLALDKANGSYQSAINKLSTGRGNVIRQAESFKQLGVEVKQDIPNRLVDRSNQS